MEHSEKIKLGIVGYGNLGKGAELAIKQNKDMELIAVFTRRAPEDVDSSAQVVAYDKIEDYKDKIDVMLLCGGSAKDLPKQSLEVSKQFNTVDSFDTHAKIPEYFEAVDKNARKNQTLSLISTGWDPGLFSMARLLGQSVLPEGDDYTFWGKGLSQGHSDAVRKVEGVKAGVQYTIPNETYIEDIRSGKTLDLSAAERHNRVCYVVAEPGADKSEIEHKIKTMPHYFEPYDTTVHFISEAELKKNHSKMPHGGHVFRSGSSAKGSSQRIEFALKLESNAEFTSSVLVTFSRAVHYMHAEGKSGALTVFDIPLGKLSPLSSETLRKNLL